MGDSSATSCSTIEAQKDAGGGCGNEEPLSLPLDPYHEVKRNIKIGQPIVRKTGILQKRPSTRRWTAAFTRAGKSAVEHCMGKQAMRAKASFGG